MNLNVFLSSIRNNPWVTPVTMMALVLGALLAVSLKTQQSIRSTSLPSNRFSGLAAAYRDQQEQLKMANEEISKLRERTTQYENEMASASEKTRLLNNALQEAKFLAGLTPVEGPGIEVVLQDSKKRPPANSPIDIENYIIHDSDLQRVVNELHAAGAEAVSINGQRIIANTAIRCVGPTIQVNGIALSSPYVIQAIGDPETLMGALNLPQGVLADIQAIDPNMVKVTKKNNIQIPAYTGSLVFRYAKPVVSTSSNASQEERDSAR
ncbi:MAG: hypothetical protein KatS3mg023_1302 [Armatimonadota bacterium]|nr:MAG: hypothetical protein KatS3mg023_1302 [Armatimonadota bacterium]